MTLDKSTPHTLSHLVEKHVSTGRLWRAMPNTMLLNSISHLPVFPCFNFHSLQTWALASRLFLAHSCLIFHVTFFFYKIRCFILAINYTETQLTQNSQLYQIVSSTLPTKGGLDLHFASQHMCSYTNDHIFKCSPLYTKIVSASLPSSCDFTELLCLIISHWLDELQLRPHETWLWKPSFWH